MGRSIVGQVFFIFYLDKGDKEGGDKDRPEERGEMAGNVLVETLHITKIRNNY